jgi:hypothetical protein
MPATLTIFLLLISPPWMDIQSMPMPSMAACVHTKEAIEREAVARIGYKFGLAAGQELVMVVRCDELDDERDG